MNKTYVAHYESELINVNSIINSNKCSCILFKNLSNNTIIIDNVIPLLVNNTMTFNEQAYVEIQHNFNIKFDNNQGLCLVVKTFYKEI